MNEEFSNVITAGIFFKLWTKRMELTSKRLDLQKFTTSRGDLLVMVVATHHDTIRLYKQYILVLD